MPPITAILHSSNDALRLGRTLEMLLPCSQILLIDHHSSDRTRAIARQYGARVIDSDTDPSITASAINDWIFRLHPGESMSESLQASFFEFSMLSSASIKASAFSVLVRGQAADGRWQQSPQHETRLFGRNRYHLHNYPLPHDPSAPTLEGELLRFVWP